MSGSGEGEAAGEGVPPAGRWRLRGARRSIAILAIVAVAALAGGLVLGRFVVSPAERAAQAAPPPAGPITAPIEKRVVASTVTTRADVTYADAVDVKPDVSALSGPAVVTGRVPEVGSTLDAGSVALEVSGRPLIVLPGALPAYRTVRAGLSGPDVAQLKESLRVLGIDPGGGAADSYDAGTAAAVDELYRRAGYPAPADAEADRQASSARAAVRSARSAVDQAATALRTAQSPAGGAALLELDNAVREAQRELDAARADPAEAARVDALSDALALAVVRRDEASAAPDASAERAALDAAGAQLSDAESELADAELNALTPLPAGEIAYLPTLPRRVDSVSAVRGRPLDGTAMSVSGASLVLQGSAGDTDAALLKPGTAGTFTAPSGSRYTATVQSVELDDDENGRPGASGTSGGSGGSDGSGGDADGDQVAARDRYTVLLAPQALDDATVAALRGQNVKVAIPVQSTEGPVLAVPIAALTAGPGGESRIELQNGDATELVDVITGLAADGYAEIRSDDPRVLEGARVVVGR